MFQSTRPRGARHDPSVDLLDQRGFQSTRPRGARPISDRLIYRDQSFNPRARAGRDAEYTEYDVYSIVFQSTRPRGARPLTSEGLTHQEKFQSTRPRGARPGSPIISRFE